MIGRKDFDQLSRSKSGDVCPNEWVQIHNNQFSLGHHAVFFLTSKTITTPLPYQSLNQMKKLFIFSLCGLFCLMGLRSVSAKNPDNFRSELCNTTAVQSITACDSLLWIDGITYTSNNNTATFIIPNSAGCDSIITLDLIITPSPSNDFLVSGNPCAGDTLNVIYTGNARPGMNFTWDFGGGINLSGGGPGPLKITWPSAGTKNICLTVSEGRCISAQNCQTLDIIATPVVSIDSVLDQCFSGNSFNFSFSGDTAEFYQWNFGSGASPAFSIVNAPPPVTYQVPGIKTVSLLVANGVCPANSAATTTFEVRAVPSTVFMASATDLCDGDSIDIMYLGLDPDSSQSYFWDFGPNASLSNSTQLTIQDLTYSALGPQNIILTVTDGPCLATDTLEVRVNQIYEVSDSILLCLDDSLIFGSQVITDSGFYREVFTSLQGCDSVVNLTVSKGGSFESLPSIEICEGDSVAFAGQFIKQAGTYEDVLMAADGCDSIRSLEIAVVQALNTMLLDTICPDDLPYLFAGQVITASGTYVDSLQSSLGCDSLVSLELLVDTPDTEVFIEDLSIKAAAVADAYQWLDCNQGFSPILGDDSSRFIPPTNGNYAVELRNGTCIDTSECVLFDLLSISPDPSLEWNLFPNPTTERVVLDLQKPYKEVHVSIINSLGQEIQHVQFRGVSSVDVPIRGSAGVYLIKVSSSSGLERSWRVSKM